MSVVTRAIGICQESICTSLWYNFLSIVKEKILWYDKHCLSLKIPVNLSLIKVENKQVNSDLLQDN